MTDDMTEGPIKIVVNGYKDLAGNDRVVIVEGGWKIVIFIRSKAGIK